MLVFRSDLQWKGNSVRLVYVTACRWLQPLKHLLWVV
jgi:hypothetical protein